MICRLIGVLFLLSAAALALTAWFEPAGPVFTLEWLQWLLAAVMLYAGVGMLLPDPPKPRKAPDLLRPDLRRLIEIQRQRNSEDLCNPFRSPFP